MRRRQGPPADRSRVRSRVSGHLETLRPYDLVLTPLLSMLGALLATASPGTGAVALAGSAGLAACASALYGNDVLTRREDEETKPHRPIPSGRVSPRAATACTALLGLAALVPAVVFAPHSLVFVALGGATSYAYGRWLKDRGLWGDMATGFSGWSCAVLAGACFTAHWPPAAAVWAALALGAQGTFSNLLLAVADLPNDLSSGCRTLPVRRGTGYAVSVLGALALLAYAVAALIPAPSGHGRSAGTVALLVAAGVLCLTALLVARARPARAVELHLYERVTLPGALWALTDRAVPAVLLTALAAVVVALTPRPMLARDTEPAEAPASRRAR